MICPYCHKDTQIVTAARQTQILELMRSGVLSNKEIAATLQLSPATAATYVKRILPTLGVKNRREFAAKARITRRPLPALNPRLRQIAELLINGQRYHEIAATLNLSVNTIHSHARRIFDLAGADGRYDLAMRFTAEHG